MAVLLEASNGPVVAWPYPVGGGGPEPIPGRVSGPIATGSSTADDLIGPLAGGSLDALFDEIMTGNADVNVHTAAHPGGEIVGTIDRPRGHVGT